MMLNFSNSTESNTVPISLSYTVLISFCFISHIIIIIHFPAFAMLQDRDLRSSVTYLLPDPLGGLTSDPGDCASHGVADPSPS